MVKSHVEKMTMTMEISHSTVHEVEELVRGAKAGARAQEAGAQEDQFLVQRVREAGRQEEVLMTGKDLGVGANRLGEVRIAVVIDVNLQGGLVEILPQRQSRLEVSEENLQEDSHRVQLGEKV